MVATIVTNNGAGFYVDKFDGSSTATVFYIGWGTGGSSTGSTATYGDTALQAEATEARVLATLSQPAADTNRLVATITAGTAKTVEEVGVFTATAAGTMVGRGTHLGVGLSAADAIQYTFNIQAVPT